MAAIPEQGSINNIKAGNAGVQLADIPRIDANKLVAAAEGGREKLAGLVKRKKHEDDDFQNSGDNVGGTTEDVAATGQDSPMQLAQAESVPSAAGGGATGAGTATGGAASTGGGAAGAGTAAAGAEAAGAFALSDAALGTLILAGAAGVAVAAGGGGGAAAAVVSNIVTGTIVAGPVVGTHGLQVNLYQGDGTTLLNTTPATVDANGQFSINVGSYSGVVIARVINAGAGADYIDEASGQAVDLTATLMAVGVAGGGNVTLNINPLTTVAAVEAGVNAVTGVPAAPLTSTAVNDANTAVATTFGLTNLTGEAVVTTVTSAGVANPSYVPTDGLTNAEKYGAVLASLSGMDATGGAQATITTLAAGLTVTGTGTGATGSLNAATLDALVAGTAAAAPNTTGSLLSVLSETLSQTNASVSIDAIATDNAISATEAGAGVTLTGTNAAGATVNLSIGGATVAATVTGTTWSYTLQPADYTAMGEGAEAISATATLTTGTGATATTTTATASRVIAIDTVAPTLTITSDVSAVRAGQTATISFTFSEAPSGFAAGDITTTGGTLSNFTVTANPKVYTAIFTPTPDTASGTASITVAAGVYLDAIGNNGGAGTTPTINIDTLVPTALTFALASDTGTSATDGITDVGTVNVSGLEAGATWEYSTNGGANWTAGSATSFVLNEGNYPAGSVQVRQIDTAGNVSTAGSNAAVIIVDVSAPVFTSATGVNYAENGTAAAYTVAATDATALTYTLTGGADAGRFTINQATGAVSFNASPNFEAPADLAGAGSTAGDNVYDITVTATDALGRATNQNVAITVTDINEAPTVVAQNAPATQVFAVNQPIPAQTSVAAMFVDPDANTGAGSFGALTYTATGLPTGITLDPTTGVISGTPTTTVTAAPVTFTATDGGGSAVTHSMTVDVVTAPVISAVTASVTQATSGNALTFTATVSEAVAVTGSPTLTLDVGGTAMTATYTAGSGTNSLTFTATAPATGTDATVTVTAINLNGGSVVGNVTTQPLVTATVGQVVGSFVIDNTAPSFTSAATANAAENQTAAYTAASTDATAVAYTLTGGADMGAFTINQTTGAVSFNAAPNFEAPTDSGNDGTYNIIVTATDAVGHATNQNVAITVTNVNEAPTLNGTPTPPTFVVNQSITANNNVTGMFVDPENGALTYSVTGLPAGVTFDPATNLVTGTPTTTGTTNVTFTATDAGGLTVSHTMAISVVAAPTITNLATLDGVTNLDVRSDLVLTFSESISLGSGQIRIMDDMNTTGWTLTNTTTGEFMQDTFNNDVVITLLNGAVTGLTIGGVDKAAEMAGSVSINGSNLVIASGGSGVTDWDFGANYHVELDAGVVKNAGNVGNMAIADATTLNFTTVTPVGTATGAASQQMAADGTLAAGYTWHHGHVQDATQAGLAMDFSVGNHALMLQGNGLDVPLANPLTDKTSTNIGGKVLLSGFGVGDSIYMDNMGDMNQVSTDGHKGASYIGSGNTLARVLDNLDGGTQLQTVFADYATTGFTNITSLGGADIMLENATHFNNVNVAIFG